MFPHHPCRSLRMTAKVVRQQRLYHRSGAPMKALYLTLPKNINPHSKDSLKTARFGQKVVRVYAALHTEAQDSSSDVQDLLKRVAPNKSPEHAAFSLRRLLCSHLETLRSSHSWMQNSVYIGFIQMTINRLMNQMTLGVRSHPNFSILVQYVTESAEQMSDADVVDSVVALVCLGVPVTDASFHILLAEVRSRIPSMRPSLLEQTSQLVRILPRMDILTVRALCKRLSEEVLSDDLNSSDDLRGLCVAFVNCSVFISPHLAKLLLNVVSARAHVLLDSPQNIGSCARMAAKLNMFIRREGSSELTETIQKLLSMTVEACHKHMKEMTPKNVAEICHALKLCLRFKGPIASAFQDQAKRLFREDQKLCDLSNLMYCVTSNTDQELKDVFQQALISELSKGITDIVIISNLAENLRDFGFIDKSLLILFQNTLSRNADRIVKYISRFNKVSKFVVRKRFVNAEDEAMFFGALIRHVDQDFTSTYELSLVSKVLLQSSRYAVPEQLFEQLQAVIPRLSEVEIYHLVIGINAIRKPETSRFKHQVDTLQSLLYANLMNRIDGIRTFDYLHQLTLGLSIHNHQNRDLLLTEKLMHKYQDFTPKLQSESDLVKVAQVFHSLKYHIPEVCDDLVKNFVDLQTKDSHKTLTVLLALAKLGHIPVKADRFVLACLDAYDDFRTKRAFDHMLNILLCLMHLTYPPEEELVDVFNLDFIQDLEEFISKHKSRGSRAQDVLMQLNRAAILDCPQLDTPWFHDRYCQDNTVSEEPQTDLATSRLRDEVDQVLRDILESDEFYSRWVYTPYCYSLGFECALGNNMTPLAKTEYESMGKSHREDYQRVAILTPSEHDFCMGTRQLDGPNRTKRRHLEIMGYKVVEIAPHDWYAIALGDWEAKADFLQSQIFS